MAFRICGQRGCPKATENPYCPEHSREREARRGTKAERGYGREYQAQRRLAAAQVQAGGVHCWRCGNAIQPGEPFDLGHDDNDRTVIRGPECPPCNRSAAGKSAHRYQ